MYSDHSYMKQLQQKVAYYQKLQKNWALQRQGFQKNMKLLEQEIKKQKTINARLMNKKNAHKRTCSDQQMFIFNQTNISSYYNHPVVLGNYAHHNQNWVTKANLRSHLDGVRAMCWLEQFLITGGVDGLLKIWERERLKVTVREHLAPIYTICKGNDQLFTGGAQGVVRMWNIKSFMKDERPAIEEQLHEDSIWQLIYDSSSNLLVSSSADDSLKLCKLANNGQSLNQFHKITMKPYTPTSICFLNSQQISCGTTNSPKIFLFNLQNPHKPLQFQFTSSQQYYQPNKLLLHHQTNQLISGHEDKYLRIFDKNSKNANIKNIVAHSDAITGLSVKSTGSGYQIFTCGHDGSVRVWDLRQYRCLADVSVYMRKYDQGAMCIEYSDGYWQGGCAAVGGADGQIKLLGTDH